MTYEQIIQKAGKRIIPRVYYYENGVETSLDRDDFQQAKFKFNASLVGTVMYGVELEVKTLLPDTLIFIEITAKYDVYTQKKVFGGYLKRGEPTYNADNKTYTYEMYDKIITAMVDYKPISIAYPTTIYSFFKQLITELGFTSNIASLPNGTKTIEKDIYDGINYTYRDVLNDIGQATGTLFVIDDNEIKKCELGTSIKTINDDILKNQNITLGKHFGPINTIVLTRSGESDSIYYPEVLPANPIEFRIADNQLMNENDREDYLEAIYNQLNGIEFDIYDTALVGYGGFTPLEKIKISTGGKEYNSYVFNNEITISQGYEEVIYTEMPTETSTDYKASDSTDRRINQVYIIARKNEKEIVAVIDTTNKLQKEINPTKDESGSEIIIKDASNNSLTYLEIEGKSTQKTRSGKNKANLATFQNGYIHAKGHLVNDYSKGEMSSDFIEVKPNTTYTFSIIETTGTNESWLGVAQYTSNASISADYFIRRDTNTNTTATSITFTTTSDAKYVIVCSRNLIGATKVQFEEGTATEYEPYGVSPSPEFPSEIESVGYENLFNPTNVEQGAIGYSIGKNYGSLKQDSSIRIRTANLIKLDSNKIYTISCREGYDYVIQAFDNNGLLFNVSNFSNTWLSNSQTFSGIPNIAIAIRKSDNTSNIIPSEIENVKLILVEDTQRHSYIPYGKYGIEVETINKNYLNISSSSEITLYQNIEANIPMGDYVITWKDIITNGQKPSMLIQFFCDSEIHTTAYISSNYTNKLIKFTAKKRITTVRVYSQTTYNESVGITTTVTNLMISKEGGEYQPYQKNTSSIVLNQPLRSLPNGVKDIAYIKNNKLYVDRYVGSVVLDGSENWVISTLNDYQWFRYNLQGIQKNSALLSDYFKDVFGIGNNVGIANNSTLNRIYLSVSSEITTVEQLKTWLSTHNAQVDYELATPTTEELGEIEMLKTLKGYNDILTTDELLPIINLTYVRDTILADYVENHVTELKLTESEIKASVEKVSSSVDGLNSSINRVEEITNDNSQVINIISTNIDKTSGEVREVTTTTGFTFNADGMTINDGSGFKAQHTASGTYYKDGESITGQYTKDGSKQKDLELFGTYSYGKESIDDTPMFVGQLYNDENGEECFGHFYNGGDY